jgi:hypothetical protein
MLVWFVFFIISLIILYFISKKLVQGIYLSLLMLTKNSRVSIGFLTFILLPGTIVHEVGHMRIAELLGVKTGEFNFMPEVIEDNKIKAGSIAIQKSDPIRQSLIGLSPILFGISIIFLITNFIFQPLILNPSQIFNQNTGTYILYLISLYFIFAVSNSMFSSHKDLETVLYPIILIIIVGGALLLIGIKISLSDNLSNTFNNIFKQLGLALVFSALIDFILAGLTKLFNSVMIKINARPKPKY